MSTLHFLGAAGTVTGSRHLVEHEGRRVLLDCGLFQGEKPLRQRNWERFPVDPATLDAVVLSHAHIDHTGWLPRLVKEGFKGRVWATPATRALAGIMLPDSGRIQEEEAEFANRKRYSKHSPALPLYTEDDADRAVGKIRALGYDDDEVIAPGISLRFTRAGHILGSATVSLALQGSGPRRSLVFSGDLGRYGMPIIPDPEARPESTTLLVECTYGNRTHGEEDPRAALGRLIRRVVEEKRVLVVPAFAIGRTQDLLFHLRQLQLTGDAPSLPVYVDSPMACDATPLYLAHREEHDEEMVRQIREGRRPLEPHALNFARGREESRALNELEGPLVIISASGMATGGRILHHLARRLPDPKTTVLFVGYQAAGSRGGRLLAGERTVRIHGQDVPVNAEITRIPGFSAHAGQDELDRWLASHPAPPGRTFLVHGEADALEAMRARLASRGWNAHVPAHGEKAEI